MKKKIKISKYSLIIFVSFITFSSSYLISFNDNYIVLNKKTKTIKKFLDNSLSKTEFYNNDAKPICINLLHNQNKYKYDIKKLYINQKNLKESFGWFLASLPVDNFINPKTLPQDFIWNPLDGDKTLSTVDWFIDNLQIINLDTGTISFTLHLKKSLIKKINEVYIDPLGTHVWSKFTITGLEIINLQDNYYEFSNQIIKDALPIKKISTLSNSQLLENKTTTVVDKTILAGSDEFGKIFNSNKGFYVDWEKKFQDIGLENENNELLKYMQKNKTKFFVNMDSNIIITEVKKVEIKPLKDLNIANVFIEFSGVNNGLASEIMTSESNLKIQLKPLPNESDFDDIGTIINSFVKRDAVIPNDELAVKIYIAEYLSNKLDILPNIIIPNGGQFIPNDIFVPPNGIDFKNSKFNIVINQGITFTGGKSGIFISLPGFTISKKNYNDFLLVNGNQTIFWIIIGCTSILFLATILLLWTFYKSKKKDKFTETSDSIKIVV